MVEAGGCITKQMTGPTKKTTAKHHTGIIIEVMQKVQEMLSPTATRYERLLIIHFGYCTFCPQRW